MKSKKDLSKFSVNNHSSDGQLKEGEGGGGDVRALNVALEAAHRAAEVTLEGWNKPLSFKHKGVVDLVTEFDQRAEVEAMKVLKQNFPGDFIVAEESGGDQPALGVGEQGPNGRECEESDGRDGEGMVGRRVWHVDPLDGTNNFAHGFPMFASSVGLLVDGEPVVGAIVAPAVGWTFSARRGGGALFNGSPMRVSKTPDMDACLAVTGFPYTRRQEAEKMARRVKVFLEKTLGLRRIGAAALDLCFVACGWFDFFFESSLHTWDVAAGSLLVGEAGGKVTDWRGLGVKSAVGKGEIAASNGLVHSELLKVLGDISADEEG